MKRRDFLKIAPIGAVAVTIMPSLLNTHNTDRLVLELDMNEYDWQFLESRQFKIEEIARAFNYPVEIMNSTPMYDKLVYTSGYRGW
jgi:hypothetical protein